MKKILHHVYGSVFADPLCCIFTSACVCRCKAFCPSLYPSWKRSPLSTIQLRLIFVRDGKVLLFQLYYPTKKNIRTQKETAATQRARTPSWHQSVKVGPIIVLSRDCRRNEVNLAVVAVVAAAEEEDGKQAHLHSKFGAKDSCSVQEGNCDGSLFYFYFASSDIWEKCLFSSHHDKFYVSSCWKWGVLWWLIKLNLNKCLKMNY